MTVSNLKQAPAVRANRLKEKIKNQQLFIEDLTSEIERMTTTKDEFNQQLVDYSGTLKQLVKSGIPINKQSQIINLIINQLNAVFISFRFHSRSEFEITWANREYETLIRNYFTGSEDLNSPVDLNQIINKEDRDVINQSYDFFIKNPEKTFHTIYQRKIINGTDLWIVIHSVVIRLNKNGEPEEVIGLLLDLTDRVVAEQKLEKLEEENIRLKCKMKRMTLTKREKEIVGWIIRGFTNKEIAKALNISPHTVDTHRKSIMKKLQLKNTAALVNYAAANGIT